VKIGHIELHVDAEKQCSDAVRKNLIYPGEWGKKFSLFMRPSLASLITLAREQKTDVPGIP
jgi:hypothetical protein